MGDLRYNQIEKCAVLIVEKTQDLGSMTASTEYEGFLTPAPILDANQDGVGGFGNSSLETTNSVFLIEKPKVADLVDDGDYFINYKTGYFKVIAGASATPVATWNVKVLMTSATADFTGATIGDVKIEDGTLTTKLKVAAATAIVAADNAAAVHDAVPVRDLRILAEGEVTVVTSGTPVPIAANTSAKAVLVMNNNTGKKVAVGLAASVDAISDPPVGKILFVYDAYRVGVNANSNEVYVDADDDGVKVSYHILG